MLYDLYKYDEWHYLLYDNGVLTCDCNLTDNRNMNQRLVKLHKGVNNEVKFRVFDSDRKRTRIDNLRITITLINTENREVSFTTTAKHSPERGVFVVHFFEGDLVNMNPGFYDFIVTGEEWAIPEQPGDIRSTPFYTDTAANMLMKAEITQQGEKLPTPTIEIYSKNPKTGISDWIASNETVDDVYTRIYHSSPIPANRLRNHKAGTHSFALTCENFTGRFEVRGSLEHIPPSEAHDYFPLNLTAFRTSIDYGEWNPTTGTRDPFTGIDPFTFEANIVWLMFVWIPTDENGVPIDEMSFPSQWEEPVKRLQVRS